MAKKKRKATRKRAKRSTGVTKHHKKKHRIKMPKKPKKPKVSAPVSSWANYDRKMSDWNAKVRHLQQQADMKHRLIQKHRC